MKRYLDQRLRLQLIRVVNALETHGSLLKASAALGVSQPALTKSLRDIEEIVGARIFERHARGVRPTEAGVVLIRSCRRILAELRRTEEDLDLLMDVNGGQAAIGVLPAAAGLAPMLLVKLQEDNPAFRIRLEEGRTEEMLPLLAAGQIDLIVGRFYEAPSDHMFVRKQLWSDPIVIVARAGHPILANHPLDLKELGKYRLILSIAPRRVAAEVEALLEPLGLVDSAMILSTSYSFTREILLTTDAFTIMPPMVLLGDVNRNVLGMRAVPVSYPLWPAGIITVRDRELNGASRAFISCVEDNINKIIDQQLLVIE